MSLSSLAFILCSAIRRTRAASCAALHCFPDITSGRKMAVNSATKMATVAPIHIAVSSRQYARRGQRSAGKEHKITTSSAREPTTSCSSGCSPDPKARYTSAQAEGLVRNPYGTQGLKARHNRCQLSTSPSLGHIGGFATLTLGAEKQESVPVQLKWVPQTTCVGFWCQESRTIVTTWRLPLDYSHKMRQYAPTNGSV